jgi:hypothetical protein
MKIGNWAAPTFVAPCDAVADDLPPPFDVDLTAPPDARAIGGDAIRAAQDLIAASLAPVTPPTPTVARELAPTPLELAIQDLLASAPRQVVEKVAGAPLAEHDEPVDDPSDGPLAQPLDLASAPSHEPAQHVPGRPVATTAVREPAPLPENTNPNHVHLVVDNGADRIVVTVAVRGSDVHVGMRTNNDDLAAALARNAGVLDHAMLAKGLDLSGFTAERDLPRERGEPERHEPQPSAEPFQLEETP